MILQSLKGYYDRLARDPDSGIPQFGYSREKISWVVVIDRDGNLVSFMQLGNIEKNKHIPMDVIVPQRVKKSVNIASNFLWGDTGYVLGIDTKGKPERSLKTFEAFRMRLHEVGDSLDDSGMQAVIKFADRWDNSHVKDIDEWDNIVDTNVVFRLDGERSFIHDRAAVRDAYLTWYSGNQQKDNSVCLVTGENTSIANLHPAIGNVRGAQSSGANIVCFNIKSSCSYGKEQGANAPVGEYAAFAYTTALNWLLRRDSMQKIQIGDATTVFWAEKPSPMEHSFYYMFNPPVKKKDDDAVDDPATAKDLKVFFDAIRQGKYREIDDDADATFYVLGLSPNSARISVRFWHVSTIIDIAEKIRKHLQDTGIEKEHTNDPDQPGIWQYLAQTAARGDLDSVPPLLAGAVMRSILTGSRYPENLLAALIGRIRSEQDDTPKNHGKINYIRMSLLKGCLVRNHNREVSMSLNKENTDPAYLLGRLFAVLERSQEDAAGGQLNSTIKDRYFGSASATPRAVFPRLLRLNQHHIAKGEHGGYYDRIIGEIMELLPAGNLPAHMPLDDQGLFAIGYYHQRNDFFKKQKPVETSE